MPRLSLDEAARLLDVRSDTLRRWVRQGLVRGVKDLGGTLFERSELERWAREHRLAPAGGATPRRAPAIDLLADAIERGPLLRTRPAHAQEAIERCIEALDDLEPARRAALLEDVLARERMASTGLGHGVALPHPRKPPGELFEQPVVGVLFAEEPLDWAALDGEPVHSVLLLLSPSAAVHVQLLSRIAFALRTPEFPAFLRSRPGREELVERLRGIRKET